MKLRPMFGRVIVKADAPAEKTAGGVFIPENATQSEFIYGTVIAAAEEGTYSNGHGMPMFIEVDDCVLFHAGCGMPIKIDGEEHIVLSQGEIVACVEDEESPS